MTKSLQKIDLDIYTQAYIEFSGNDKIIESIITQGNEEDRENFDEMKLEILSYFSKQVLDAIWYVSEYFCCQNIDESLQWLFLKLKK